MVAEVVIVPVPASAESMSTQILIMLSLMLISVVVGQAFKKMKIKFIQESTLTTLIGIATGGMLYCLKESELLGEMRSMQGSFVSLFMVFFLPAIIFQAGYSMNKALFYKFMGSIMVFAFVGSFIASMVTSGIVWLAGYAGICKGLSFKESAAFGALISSTDPVAVLAIFKEIHADANLYYLIFGESALNDVLSMILYRTVVNTNDPNTSLWTPVLEFFISLFGSISFGMATGFAVAFLLKRQSLFGARTHNVEVISMCLCPWVTYLVAENIKLTGIVSIFFNGIILSTYAAPNLSSKSASILKSAYETTSYASETLVFLYLGLGLFAFDHSYKDMGVMLLIVAFFAIAIGRLFNVYGLSMLINLCTRKKYISYTYMFAMWVSGLRGAMAYALALKAFHDLAGGNGGVILILTLLISQTTVIIVATAIHPIMAICNLKSIDLGEHVNEEIEDQGVCGSLKRLIYRLHTSYLQHIFIKPATENRDEHLPNAVPNKGNEGKELAEPAEHPEHAAQAEHTEPADPADPADPAEPAENAEPAVMAEKDHPFPAEKENLP